MPFITRFSNDNFQADRQYLAQTLEMFMTGTIIPIVGYNSNGDIHGLAPSLTSVYVNTLVDDFEGFVGIYMWRRYHLFGESVSWPHLVKTNFIVPQVIMYYFPQSWFEIYKNYIYRRNSIELRTVYLIEGREVVFLPTAILLTERGGSFNRDALRREGFLR